MATPWIDRIVELKHMEDCGRMKVETVDGSWVGCVPIDPDTMTFHFAKATTDGVLWFRKPDLQECPTQEETLL